MKGEKIGSPLFNNETSEEEMNDRNAFRERKEMIGKDILNNILAEDEQRNEELVIACERYIGGRIMKRYPDTPNEDTDGMVEMQEARQNIQSCVGRERAEKIIEIIENSDW